MNYKKMFIGLITSIALVFTVALALPSNNAESFISTNRTNMRAGLEPPISNLEGTYVSDTVVAPNKLPANFTKQKLGEYQVYSSDFSEIYSDVESDQSSDFKLNINFIGLPEFSSDSQIWIKDNTSPYNLFDSDDFSNGYDMFIAFTVYDEVKFSSYQYMQDNVSGDYERENYKNTTLDKGIYLLYVDYAWESHNPKTDEYFSIVQINISKYDFDSKALIDKQYKVINEGTSEIDDSILEGTYTHRVDNIMLNFDFMSETHAPGISGETTVINNIDKPYTVERIKQIAMLTAKDEYFGDLTEEIEIVRDDYTANNKKIGDYEIEFRVENPAGLSANFILIVANRDLVAPVITGPGTSTMSYTEEFVLSNLMAKFTVKDNHDTGVKLVHLEDDFEQGKPGVYTFRFSATDASKNESIFVHTMTVVDDQKAIITDSVEGPIEVNWRDKVTNEMLLVGLTAHDEISGELTDRLKVTNNPIKKELGTYQVEYQVIDDAGNVSKYTRTYKVITTDAPIFYVSKNLILISDVNLLTTQQIVDELARYENIQYASHMVIENEYEGNEYVVGTYQIKVAINDTKGVEHIVQRSMQVFEDSEELNTQLSLWQKIVKFFKDAWNLIKKVAITIWDAIMWLPRLIINFFKKKSLVLFLSL